MLAAGLDLGGSSVKAWVAEIETGQCLATTAVPTPTLRPEPTRAELDPRTWEAACRSALTAVVAQAARPGQDYAGLTVCSLRQGFVLLDAGGEPLGNGVLNSDRRGAAFAHVLAGTHSVTGHWPAPELTLPKLMAVRAEEPERWAATTRVLFLHDWVLWRLTGRQVTETSYACAGGMADVARRTWAVDLLEQCGIGTTRLAPLVESGAVVGELVDGWPLPATLPVVAGSGDTQVAALGVGGLADGVVTVVAGSSTPVQAATAAPVDDPLERPWVSTHAAAGLWAAEGNAGYPGALSGWWAGLVAPGEWSPDEPSPVTAVTAAPYWSRETWERRPPATLLGLQPETSADDVAAALLQAHAFGVAGNVDDLERALRRTASAVVVTGGAAADGRLPRLLAAVMGRDVHWAPEAPAAAGGCHLVARAVGAHSHPPSLPERVVPGGDAAPWVEPRQAWEAAHVALRASSG